MSIIKNLPDNFNILSPVAFRFETRKIPNVTYFVQTANIPGMSTSEFLRETPFKAIPTVGDTLEVETLDITFVVDEDLANYQEIINWLIYVTNLRIKTLEDDGEPDLIKDELKMANYVLYKLGKLEDMGDI